MTTLPLHYISLDFKTSLSSFFFQTFFIYFFLYHILKTPPQAYTMFTTQHLYYIHNNIRIDSFNIFFSYKEIFQQFLVSLWNWSNGI